LHWTKEKRWCYLKKTKLHDWWISDVPICHAPGLSSKSFFWHLTLILIYFFVTERCTSLLSGSAFHSWISALCVIAVILITVACIAYPSAIIHLDPRVRWTDRADRAYAALICLVCSCVAIQVATAMTCRSAEIIFDLRYTSMIVVQVSGLVACVIFAYHLGASFGAEMPSRTL
jgi:hypothetical protein